jgi:hypothetical protein
VFAAVGAKAGIDVGTIRVPRDGPVEVDWRDAPFWRVYSLPGSVGPANDAEPKLSHDARPTHDHEMDLRARIPGAQDGPLNFDPR